MKDFEKNRLGEMLSRAQQALAAKPNDQAVISGLATVLMQLGRLDEAEEHYRKSMSMDGSHIGTLVNYAILLDQRGKSDDACHLFKKALEINPTNPSALSSYAHILCKLGNYLRAEELLKRAVKRCPTDVTLLHNYGCLLWEGRKDYTRAEEILKKVVKLDPCHQASTQALEELREARARAEEEAAYHAQTLLAELAGIDGSRDQMSKGERPGAATGPARTNCVPVKNRARAKKKGMKGGEDVAGEQQGGAAEETDALHALCALGGAAKNEPHSDIQLNEADVPVMHVDGQAQQASKAHASTMQGNGAAAVEQPQQKSTSPPRSPAAFSDDRARCRYADCRSCVSAYAIDLAMPLAEAGAPIRGGGGGGGGDVEEWREWGDANRWQSYARSHYPLTAEERNSPAISVYQSANGSTLVNNAPYTSEAAAAHAAARFTDDVERESEEEELDAEGSLAYGLKSLASEIHQRMKEEFEETPLSAVPYIYPRRGAHTAGSAPLPPSSPAQMRSWLKYMMQVEIIAPVAIIEAPDGAPYAKDESSEDYLIDDHGIMHVIPRRLGADSTHTYSNWRDRRQGAGLSSAPLLGGDRGDSIQISVAEAALAAREREALERAAKQREEAEILELREVKEQLMACTECCVCLEAPRACVLRPCNHLCVCATCAQELREGQGTCPLCRLPVNDVLSVFL